MGTEIMPLILILISAIAALVLIYWAMKGKSARKIRLSVVAIALLSIGVFLQVFFSSLSKAPEGYIEECYGDDFEGNLVGKQDSYTAVLDLDQSEWGKLEITLEEFSSKNNLKLFKDIRDTEGLQMFNVSLCSSAGLYINADKRIWNVGDSPEHIPFPLTIRVTIYKNDAKWRSIPNQLNKVLMDAWPDDLKTEHDIRM